MTEYIRGVTLAEISGTARLGINILQNLYNGLNIFLMGDKNLWNFLKYGYNLWFN